MSKREPDGALSGLRVIDFTQVLAGPFCTQLLADQGADVIKVEPPHGDQTRGLGPFRPDDEQRAYGGYFQSVNRNKRGICLDLKTAEGRQAALRLIDGADVVVENYRPGVMDRLGLGYDVLAERNPRLVYAAISGFGHERTGASPHGDWPALDIVAQAMGGVISITGLSDHQPIKVGPGIGDLFPGALAAFGVLAAVLHARSTGEGQFLDVAMVDGVLALCERIVHQHSYTGEVPAPEGNEHPILCPYGLFRSRDGWISISAHSNKFWAILCEEMGDAALADDERFATPAARLQNRVQTYDLVNKFAARHSTAELVAMLQLRIPIGPVNTVQDIFANEHFRMREMLASVEQPGAGTPVTIAGVPIRMTKTQGRVRHRAPLLGEHNAEIFAELGLDADVSPRHSATNVIIASGEVSK